MDASVSLPDPGEFHHPLQNGHAPGLVIDDLEPFDPTDESVGSALDALDEADLRGDGGILPLQPADVADVLAIPGSDLTPDAVDEHTRALEAEFRAELDRLDRDGLDGNSCNLAQEEDGHADGGNYCNLAHERESAELLPGFETLTYADLPSCPRWCGDAGLPAHGDGFDTTPEEDIPHRGIEHDISVKHGGKSLDHAGRAEVSLQLEQDRDRTTGPVITLSVIVRGVEQTAWLTVAEATTLHRTLGQLLDDTTSHD